MKNAHHRGAAKLISNAFSHFMLFLTLFIACSLAAFAAPVPASARDRDSQALVDAFVIMDGPPAAISSQGARTVSALSAMGDRTKQRGLELMSRQVALQSRLAAGGARIAGHYTRIGNAIRIHVPAGRLAEIETLPGVKRVVKARHYRRALTHSVPFVGTPAVWSSLISGMDGKGVRVGVIDTGIDYLHADFGGPGTGEAYSQNDPARIEPGTFPTAKVIGGFDFAGDEYNAANPMSAIPRPDPDPLDSMPGDGHGTHVAGILAGFGVLASGQTYRGDYSTSLDFTQFTIGPGIAPRALLYALRIFGTNTDASTALIADALEWASDPNGDYDFSDRLDVVNLSLGSTFGTDDPEDPELVAVNNLARLGCVVVCAAGNDGNVFYAASPPGSASRAIAVANSIDKAERSAMQVVSPASIAGNYQAQEGDFTTPLADFGPIEAQVVYAEPADACDALENSDAMMDRIALIDRGTCFFVDKVQAAQDAGAIGVIMVNNQEGDPIIMGGENPDIYIPGVMISKADGDRLKAHLQEKPVVRLDAGIKVTLTNRLDNLSEGSSRGPVGLANYLKPEMAAPGSAIYSASAGTGTNGISYSGTSMASPAVAGAAALLRQAHPSWPVEDIKAALMNSSVSTQDPAQHPYPESLTGAGRLQIDKALQLQVTAASTEASGNVALCYGSLALLSAFQTNRTIALTNHGADAVEFQIMVSNTVPQAGVTLTPSSASVVVPAHSAVPVSFTLSADPFQFDLKHDPVTPSRVSSLPRHSIYEFSGQIWFLHEHQSIHVPYYVNLRSASEFHAQASTVVVAPELNLQKEVSLTIPMAGTAPSTNALVSAFEVGATFPKRNLLSVYSSDAHLLAVGAASDIATSDSMSHARVFFGLATATSWPSPQPFYIDLEVDIDTNNDGYADFMLFNDNASWTNSDSASDVFLNLVGPCDEHRNLLDSELDGYVNIFPADRFDTAPFNNSVLVLSAAAAQIGLSDIKTDFRYRVVTFGIFQYVSETGWIDFNARHPIVDASFSGLEGTPMHADGQPVLARLNREAAGKARQRLPGALLLHHHNVEGNRVDVVRFDLSQDDMDNDGLPDWWEFQHFGSLTVADATTDMDGDGASDRAEYLAGTDPGGSPTRITLLSAVLQADRSVKISWSGAGTNTCTILCSENLSSGTWSTLATNQGNAGSFVDTNRTETQTRFYRLRRE